jgi:hypothetical protein
MALHGHLLALLVLIALAASAVASDGGNEHHGTSAPLDLVPGASVAERARDDRHRYAYIASVLASRGRGRRLAEAVAPTTPVNIPLSSGAYRVQWHGAVLRSGPRGHASAAVPAGGGYWQRPHLGQVPRTPRHGSPSCARRTGASSTCPSPSPSAPATPAPASTTTSKHRASLRLWHRALAHHELTLPKPYRRT